MKDIDAYEAAYRNGYEQGAKEYKEQRDLLLQENAELIEKTKQLKKERDAAWNTASLLCEGFLDMPSGCDGCPLFDTMIFDEEGNGICALSRRGIDGYQRKT